jgi:hypothetical protein
MPRVHSDPRLLQVANVVAVLATIAFNGWSNAAPLNGVTMAEVSRSYPSLFTPAGWAFSIWGVIYVALLVFAVFQVRPGQRQRPYLIRIGWLHAATFVCNATWIVVFHFSYGRPGMVPLTLIPMYGLFACLLAIYLRLPIGLGPVGSAEKLAVHVPFSLYLGWVTVATMANTAFVLNAAIPGISLPIQRAFTVAVLVAVLVVGVLILRNRRDLAFALALVWAASGIAAERTDYPEIAATAAGTALIVACTILVLPRLRGQSFTAFYLR